MRVRGLNLKSIFSLQAIAKISEKVHNLEKKNGMVPIFINANTGMFRNFATISLGARGDSYYEYLIKQWMQTGKKTNDLYVKYFKFSKENTIIIIFV